MVVVLVFVVLVVVGGQSLFESLTVAVVVVVLCFDVLVVVGLQSRIRKFRGSGVPQITRRERAACGRHGRGREPLSWSSFWSSSSWASLAVAVIVVVLGFLVLVSQEA